MKIAIIVTCHWSDKIRPYGMQSLNKFIFSLSHIKYPYNLYVVDNQSEFKLTVPIENTTYLRIDDQSILGLTGAWNLGLYSAYNDGNDILINCNDDLFFNKSINHFIDYIQNDYSDNKIYSALTDGILGGHQKSNGPQSGINEFSFNECNYINGFFFAFTKEHYQKYSYTTNSYFPIDHSHNGGDGKWGGQEGYWLTDTFKTAKGVIVKDTFIPHVKYRSWKLAKNLYK